MFDILLRVNTQEHHLNVNPVYIYYDLYLKSGLRAT